MAMTVAEYQQAEKELASLEAKFDALQSIVNKGVPAMRGVYGLDQPEAQPPVAEPQQAPQMMSAHEQVGTPNVNPFQDNFTPSTNVKSMQEIAGQIAPQIDQPLGERLARGAMNLPVGMAAMAEQATSDPAGFAKGTAEYADTWMKRLNPNLMSPEAMIARQEFGQQLATDPVGTGLDALGVAGTALGLPGLGGKIKGFKSIKEARAAIKDIGKPKVDVPEVVQEPIRSETPKLGEQFGDKLGETPTIEQPTSAAEVVGKAKPSAEYPHNDLSGKVLDDGSYLDRNGNTIKSGEPIEVSFAGAPPNFPRPWTYVDGENIPSTVNYKTNASIKIRAANGKEHTLERADYYAPRKSESATDIGADLEPPQRPTTATEVVAKAKPNAVTKDVKTLTPEELTAAQARLREKFKPMDEAIDNRAGKISTEQPTATVQDAGATPAQSINTAEAVVKKAGENVNQYQLKKLDERIARQQKIMERTKPQWDKQGEIPGPLMTGRSGYKMGKKLDAQNDRMSKAFTEYTQAEREYKSLTQRREAFLRGEVHYNGQPTASSRNKGNYAQSQFDKIEVGDMIDIGGNAPLKVIKKNRATVVTESGGKWSANQISEVIKKSDTPSTTELHAGVNPFKIIDDYMTKRKLVNPLGTPEHVLSGKGIVEPFRKAQESIRNDTKLRGESLQETLKGIQRGAKEDTDLYHRLDDPKAVLNEQEQAVRNYLDDMLTEVNKHREARGQEPVKRRKGYITHLVEEVEKQSREYGDTPMPKRFRFQFELAREGNASHKVSAIEALEVYTKAALKDIYIGDALAETVPKIEAMGDRPLIFKKSVTSPDGKVTNMSFYQFSDAPIVTERGYAESFIKGQMNVPTVGQRILDKVFDIKPNTSSHAAMAVTARFYQSLLGLAVDSSVKNLTQGINTMAEMGVLPTLKGYAKLATAKGLKTAKAEHLLEDFNPLLMEGADLPFKTKTARTIGKGFSATMNAPMKVAEFINRGAAYHAAYDVYIKKGMSLEQAHEAARAAVRKTQFSYAKIDTSPALRGPFARTFSQFFSYPLKQSEMMYKWATKPGEQGKLVRYFLYTGMAVVGAKYGGVDLSGVFFDPIRMVDPNSKEGFQLPGTDKRVTFDASKLGKSGYTPQGFAPSISIPADFIKSQMSDDESAREYGRKKALTNIIPGGRYGKKVYDVITESDEKGKRDRLTRENTTKDKVLKLLGGKSTDREAESSRRETVNEVEKKYYATRQKLIDLKISGNEDEFIKLRDEFRDRYPFLYGRLMKGFGDAVKEERKKKGMTTDERFFDNSLRKQIDANL